MSGDGSGRAYVESARQELHQYAQGLLHENERLRTASAMLEIQKAETRLELLRAREERDAAVGELHNLRLRVENIQQENRRFSEDFQRIEQQSSNLANLYVASYQLHSSIDRSTVLRTIQEIVINLIGSEEIAIFEDDGSGLYRLASSMGVEGPHLRAFRAGEGTIGSRLAGSVFVSDAPSNGDSPTACVPLKVGDATIGAIVVFRLLPHKAALEDVDRELFDLLAVHAATALHLATMREFATREVAAS